MAQLQPPIVFSPGQVLTASDLNGHVSSAVVLPGVITDQTPIASNTVSASDSVLIYDDSATALRKASVGDLLGSGLPVNLSDIDANTIAANAINGKTNKDVFIVPNDGVAVTGKTFSSIDGLNVAVSSLSHGLVVGQYVQMTCSNTNYSGLYMISAASTNDFSYVLNASVAAGSGTCSYIKKASLPVNGNVSVTGNENVGGTLSVTGDAYFKSTGSVKIPAGTTAQRPSLAVVGQLRYNTTTSNTEIYNGTTWEEVGGGPFDATGGNKVIAPDATTVSATFSSADGESVVVTSGGHSVVPGQVVHVTTTVSGYSGDFAVIAADATTFTYVMTVVATPNSGSCTYNKAGNFKCHIFTSSGTFTATGKGGNVEVLVVGGGGGGRSGAGNANGGGGGGAVCYYPYYNITPGQTISVTVGSGGAVNTNGTSSTFGTIIAGGGNTGSGSTGGASGVGTALSPSNAGGTGATLTTAGSGGGGGGAGKIGQNGILTGSGYPEGSDGGDGKGSSISGISVTYGGGGAGGGRYSGVPFIATGSNGGANSGANAPANTGGGGGGQYYTGSAGTGGSGIVIVRYPYWL